MKKLSALILLMSFGISIICQDFERVSDIDLGLGYLGFASWCDYNSDGFKDVFVTGFESQGVSYAKLYQNNGDKTFSEINIGFFPNVIYGDITWGDYDNNGTPDLLYAGWRVGNIDEKITKIYKNNGNFKFTEISNDLPPLYACYLEWVDVNNDGLLDIFFQGFDSNDQYDIGIYKNLGSDKFSRIVTNINKIDGIRGNFFRNSAKWADFDNDGYKDLITAKSTSDTFELSFYKNIGDFQFTKTDIGLPQLSYVSIAVGDVNQDGYMDIVFTGSSKKFLGYSDMSADIYVFINNGNLSFYEGYLISNVGVFENTLELGDINNDGFLDILDYGTGSNYNELKVYLNNHDNTFSLISHNITKSIMGGATFGDFDNDNDLDIMNYGRIGEPFVGATYIYENKTIIQNLPPDPPDSIGLFVIKNDILISWSKGDDDSTLSNSLYYNLRLGTTSNPDSLISSNSLNSKLKYYQLGNQNLNKSYYYKNMNEGNYTISLQTIDNSYNASEFSDTIEFCFRKTQNIFKDTIVICKNDSFFLNAYGNYKSYLWNTGAKDSATYIKNEGIYNVNITYMDGCISSETTFLKVSDSLEISLGEDIEKCAGDIVTLSIPKYQNIVWSNNSTDSEINVIKSGKYWVFARNSEICYGTDTINIIFHDLPEINLRNDTIISQTDTLILSPNSKYSSIVWNDTIKCDSLIIYGELLVPGSHYYWIKVTNEFGCENTDTIVIIVKELSDLIELGLRSDINVYPNPIKNRLVIETELLLIRT